MASLTCFSLNVNGLRHKLSPLRETFQAYHVIALCETKLDDNVADSALILDGYLLFRRDRTSHGGGVACFVRCELKPKRIRPADPKGSEIVMIELEKISVLIAVVYRPPRSKDNEKTLSSIMHCISDIAGKYDRIIITGDFNFPDYPLARPSKSRLGRFINTCDNLGLKQWVSLPTRGAHILDMFLTNNLSSDVQVVDDASLSDHKPIKAVVSVAHVLYNN